MLAPDFWKQGRGSALLSPLGWIYGMATGLRRAIASPLKVPVPVLCIGNLTAGGAGKTPVAASIGQHLARAGLDVHFLTRGYGGSASGPLRVDPQCHNYTEVGDEALLLAEARPTWLSRDRAAGAMAAVADGAEVIIMDDGFQNPGLTKDISLIVVDGGYGFGNGRLIPAGPLREPLSGGLDRADGAVLIGTDETDAAAAMSGLAVLRASLIPADDAAHLKGKKVLAFAGIGRPEKFFATLGGMGANIVTTRSFADHHPYTVKDMENLRRDADRLGATLATTAKDAVRLPEGSDHGIEVLGVSIKWQDRDALDRILEPLIKKITSCRQSGPGPDESKKG